MLGLQGSAPRRKRNLADICENLPPVPFELKRSRTLNDRPVSTEGRSPAPEQMDSSEGYDSDGQHETMSAVLDFVLDAIGLGDEGLLLPVANHKEYRTKFWMELAGNDADRETMFNTLSDARTDWSALARVAIGRALADVRAFTYKNTDQPLVPSHKRKIVTQDI